VRCTCSTRAGQLQTIDVTHASYDSLMYVLLFPKGDAGWNFSLGTHSSSEITTANPRLTQLLFYRYKLHDRIEPGDAMQTDDDEAEMETEPLDVDEAHADADDEPLLPEMEMDPMEVDDARYLINWEAERVFSTVLLSQRLLQQYVVDMWCKVLTDRLLWIRLNQRKLFTEPYQGAVDALDEDAHMIGTTRMRLPATFIGSNRDLFARYHDAMAMLRQVSDNGRADFFVTFTCNPKWPELVDALRGAKPADRPDLVARVFMRKLAQLEDLLKNQNVLGYVIGCVRVIEYQQRGLPHAHLILIVRPEDRPDTAEKLDRLIYAELPDEHKEPELFAKVSEFMMHGPHSDRMKCIQGSIHPGGEPCKAGYPKDFREDTEIQHGSYAKLRRRNNGRAIIKSGKELNNQWVVPYNPNLMACDCHVNVEMVNALNCMKYLFKYILKGPVRWQRLLTILFCVVLSDCLHTQIIPNHTPT
jgi:hypothetical protein